MTTYIYNPLIILFNQSGTEGKIASFRLKMHFFSLQFLRRVIIFKPVELFGSTVSDFTNCDCPRLILVAKKVTLAMKEIKVCTAGADIIQVSLRYNLLHY
jgi:hypothetical protein